MSKQLTAVTVPDLGESGQVDVIEILVKPGDRIEAEQSLITLEGDKATMEVPSPVGGLVESIAVKVGDKVASGQVILSLQTADVTSETTPQATAAAPTNPATTEPAAVTQAPATAAPVQHPPQEDQLAEVNVHAGPAVRRIAREVGLDLTQIPGTGEKNRITKEDVQRFVQQALSGSASASRTSTASGFNFPPLPAVNFSQFGPTQACPLSKIQKISGPTLHRNWVSIPHVTQWGLADITALEDFRQAQKQTAADYGTRLTLLCFLMKALVNALKRFPHFNASLDPSGNTLILKQYFNIGVAVDTPNGLVVPVIRQVDQKSLLELGKELDAISQKARKTGLGLTDMQGGCFTISSLGGIGGVAFTPIINAPEVAILGVSKAEIKPVYQADGTFEPRLMLPLSLSYDHRVIDGADGARFVVYLSELLADIRHLLL